MRKERKMRGGSKTRTGKEGRRGCIILVINEVQDFAPKLHFDCNTSF